MKCERGKGGAGREEGGGEWERRRKKRAQYLFSGIVLLLLLLLLRLCHSLCVVNMNGLSSGFRAPHLHAHAPGANISGL